MTDKDLQILVENISMRFFQKEFLHKATFNARLRTTGGRYLLRSHNIEINKKYFEIFGMDELVGIIKHELCHYHLHLNNKGYQHRDEDFKNLLRMVGGPRHCSSLPIENKKRVPQKIIIYICQSCQQVYQRRKRMDLNKYVCGKCRGKLQLDRVVEVGRKQV